MKRGRPSNTTRALAGLGTRDGHSLTLARQLDRVRSVGLPQALRQRRLYRRGLAEHLVSARSEMYARIWEHAAQVVGAELEPVGDGFLVLRRAGIETLVRDTFVLFNDAPTMALTGDKALMYRLLKEASLPVPDHVEVEWPCLEPAREFVVRNPGLCFVKPANGTGGGAGVTGGVETPDDLWRAGLAARRFGERILVEAAVSGYEYRLMFLDFQLLDAVQRRPPSVQGDGHSDVAELIETENHRRVADRDELNAIYVDIDTALTLRQCGASLGSVPSRGQVLTVKSCIGQNARADNKTVQPLCTDLVSEAARAARMSRARLASVDLITSDPTMALSRSGGAIIEVNSPAGIHHHYFVERPDRATPVAVPILDRVLCSLSDQDEPNSSAGSETRLIPSRFRVPD